MNNPFSKLVLTGSSLVLSWVAITPAQAAILTYDIDVAIESGPLIGETYTGSFSFDNSSLSGSGSEVSPISDLMFSFLGIDYTESDDPSARVEFSDGNFLGLSFASTDPTFFFVPGFFDVTEAFFTYTTPNGAGTGDAVYTLQDPPISVPEPAIGISLLVLGISGTVFRLKKQKQI